MERRVKCENGDGEEHEKAISCTSLNMEKERGMKGRLFVQLILALAMVVGWQLKTRNRLESDIKCFFF